MGPSRLARALALARWQRAAGPYWPFVCAAPLLGGPAAFARPGAARVPRAVREAISQGSHDDGLVVFVDFPLERSIPSTPHLRGAGFAVVPVVQRWASEPAVLPCSRLVADLVSYAPPAPWIPGSRGVVFLLDGARHGRRSAGAGVISLDRAPGHRRFDNRYDYPICRFPPPGFLVARGITCVRWIGSAAPGPDMTAYATSLAEAGLRSLPA